MSQLIDLPGFGTRYAVKLKSRSDGHTWLACGGDARGIDVALFASGRTALLFRDQLATHGLPRGKVVRVSIEWRVKEETGPKRRRKP